MWKNVQSNGMYITVPIESGSCRWMRIYLFIFLKALMQEAEKLVMNQMQPKTDKSRKTYII